MPPKRRRLSVETVSSSSPPPPSPSKRRKDRVWSTGDFKLSCSDGGEFMVAAHQLKTWSTKLNGMLEVLRGKNKLKLDEDSNVILHFLNLIHHGDLKFESGADFEEYRALIAFMLKYDCPLAIRILSNLLKSDNGTNYPPLLLFCLGIECDDSKSCAAALDMPIRKWRHDTFSRWTGLGDMNLDIDMLHPSTLPRSLFNRMTSPYIWALTTLQLKKHYSSFCPVCSKPAKSTRGQPVVTGPSPGEEFLWLVSSAEKPACA